MTFEPNKGWQAEILGPKGGRWKRMARLHKPTMPAEMKESVGTKREGPILLMELDPNTTQTKKCKGKEKARKTCDKNTEAVNGVSDGSTDKVGGEAVAAKQHRQAK